jgi:type I restriction enzyme S subunit
MNMIVGAVGVSEYFGCVSPVYYTYSGRHDNSNTKFYEYLFRCKTIHGDFNSLGKGMIAIDRGEGKYNTLRLKVSRDDLRSLRLPFPSYSEQNQIIVYIETQSSKIDTLISLKEQEIEKIKEYKATLIKSAVTGEIKV